MNEEELFNIYAKFDIWYMIKKWYMKNLNLLPNGYSPETAKTY